MYCQIALQEIIHIPSIQDKSTCLNIPKSALLLFFYFN